MSKTISTWINANSSLLTDASDKIWEYAETGLKEYKSAELLMHILREAGFSIEENIADMPTAFIASYGSGKPVIAILGEYDALEGVSQAAVPVKKPLQASGSGHGCGHNLLGVGALGAALAAKVAIDAKEATGTIRFYGCPAEETLNSKGFMIRAGAFADVDISLTWHPGAFNAVWASSSLAMNSAKFRFHGRTAHAAGDPHNGRSALDAVELMNIASNYLREHVVPEARIHYSITNGGGQPNVVPAEAEVWYYVRAPKRHQVDEIYERVLKIAEGAALMTETTYEVDFIDGTYDVLYNKVIGDVLLEKFNEIGAPEFSDEDLSFASEINKTFPLGYKDGITKRLAEIPELADELKDKLLCDVVLPIYGEKEVSMGSTDVGDVSWATPTTQITTACYPLGTPGHSWQLTAAAGMGIGHKGMLTAAKVMGLAAVEFMNSPELVEKAKAEFKKRTEGREYECPMPEDVHPPVIRG